MNGRIYDPTLGRFLQADPFIQAPSNSQSFNRYSYVLNNPMSYTDPSGYFFSKLWKGVKKFASVIIVAVASYYCAGTCTAAVWAAIGGAAGATGAALNGDNILTGALVGAFTAGIGAAAGGGVASKVQGAKFGHGFWSAGLGSAIGGGHGKGFGKVLTAAVVGGTISKLTGGKFANGAISAAFVAAVNTKWGAGDSPNKPNSSGDSGEPNQARGAIEKAYEDGTLTRGKTFKTADAAASEVLGVINDLSVDIGIELGGYITSGSDGYSYGEILVGETGSLNALANNSFLPRDAVAGFHTHPKGTNFFSAGDVGWVIDPSRRMPLYLSGSNGVRVCPVVSCGSLGNRMLQMNDGNHYIGKRPIPALMGEPVQ
jgi:hypothetical protein